MKAIGVTPGKPRSVLLEEAPKPPEEINLL